MAVYPNCDGLGHKNYSYLDSSVAKWRMMRSRAFTLVEILVALAIIAVLAALLFPVFNRVRERARNTTCQSNLQQIALAVIQYAQDNNGYLPAWKSPQGNWNGVIKPYIQSEAVFHCPSRQMPLTDGLGTDYDYNMFLSGANESAFSYPSHMDINGEGGDSTHDGGPDTDVHDDPIGIPVWSPAMHSGGSNRSYLDGHVKWFPKEDSYKAW